MAASNDNGGGSLAAVLVASVASATAAIVTAKLWQPGTVMAAATTPIVVMLVNQALHRPAERISTAARTARERVATAPLRTSDRRQAAGDPVEDAAAELAPADGRDAEAGGEAAAPRTEPTRAADPARAAPTDPRAWPTRAEVEERVRAGRGAPARPGAGGARARSSGAEVPAGAEARAARLGGPAAPAGPTADPSAPDPLAPRRVYGRPRFRLRSAILAGLLAFLIAAAVLTVPELIAGESVAGEGRTTLLGGKSSGRGKDRGAPGERAPAQPDGEGREAAPPPGQGPEEQPPAAPESAPEQPAPEQPAPKGGSSSSGGGTAPAPSE